VPLPARPSRPGALPSDMTTALLAGDSLPDEALLAGLSVGDAEMALLFVRRFQGRVYGLALTLVGDRPLAEDIAQEALLKAWRHAAAFDSRRGSVTTWLLSITRNLCIDALRLRRTAPADPGLLMGLVEGDRRAAPEEAALMADTSARLRSALAHLPPDQRRAIVLAAFAGRTAREISASEHIPLGTAKTRIRAAMAKLRVAAIEERDGS
jgi:RNA polymerase sigma factor (sigma-70 family)